MISLKLNRMEKRLSAANRMVRLMLRYNEVLRLPASGQKLQIISGVAWVTVNGHDIFLASGERLRLPSRGDAALISALGRQSIILEVFGTPWGA
jgi:hypothetical protein